MQAVKVGVVWWDVVAVDMGTSILGLWIWAESERDAFLIKTFDLI